jgi:hypothetical protein
MSGTVFDEPVSHLKADSTETAGQEVTGIRGKGGSRLKNFRPPVQARNKSPTRTKRDLILGTQAAHLRGKLPGGLFARVVWVEINQAAPDFGMLDRTTFTESP